MGKELECRLLLGEDSFVGKAYLETDFLLFRGDQRLKVAFKDLTSVSAVNGNLKLEFSGGPATFELGSVAETWAHKILHPPSLLDKLGFKPGIEVAVTGAFEAAFLNQIGHLTKGKADLVLFAAAAKSDLKQLAQSVVRLKPRGVIWIVYPKGITEIREIDVIEAGRSVGLKDTKVASFSATHSALRFSQPAKAT